MGAFVANFHVRNGLINAVRDTLTQIGAKRVRLAGAHNGWVTVYEEQASNQDDAWIEKLAKELSARLDTACVAFMVHDSDIALYWLCENGQLLDQYNSAPDYFEPVSRAEKRRVSGRSDIFLRFCRPDVTLDQVEAVLRAQVTFAEDTVAQLADFLGIDPEHALADYRDEDNPDGGPDGDGDFGDDDDFDDDGDSRSHILRPHGNGLVQAMSQQLAAVMGNAKPSSSPQSDALVKAAAVGDLAEIDRHVQGGADVNAAGLFRLEPMGGPGPVPAEMLPEVPVPPLIAAASKGQSAAVQRLLELGAEPNKKHPIFGSALHAAVQTGSPDSVQLLLDAGVPADIKNMQGQSPRLVLKAIRNQIELTKNMVKNMPQLEGAYSQFASRLEAMNLPETGWDACEALLKKAGG
jgi:hypothetical protein